MERNHQQLGLRWPSEEYMDEWKERYQKSLRILNDLRKQGIAAGVYTQTTDVEVEVNGLRTYYRIDKIDPKWLKEQAAILFAD